MPRPINPAPAILSPEPSVSQETLEQTPLRLLAFLYGANTVPAAWRLLEERGYSAEEHARGWALLEAASWLKGGMEAPINDSVKSAVTALDAWDEGGFRLVTAALKHRHPDQAAFVLDGIGASVGPEAVMGVKTRRPQAPRSPDSLGPRQTQDVQKGSSAGARTRHALPRRAPRPIISLPAQPISSRASRRMPAGRLRQRRCDGAT